MRITSNNNELDRDYDFSILTACYNSSSSIRDVFNSLKKLQNKNFEWIVVNDASTDNTTEILNQILKEAEFKITLCDLEQNRMVTYCYHLGILHSKGKFLIILDHDDQIKSNALDRFLFHWNSLANNQQESLAGMFACCEDENGSLVGSYFPRSPDINNFFNLMFVEGMRGEKFFCYKTKIMQENNFQLVDRYVPESNVLYKISAKYKTLFFNEKLRVYTQPQLGGNNLSPVDPFKYPVGFRLHYLDLLNNYSSQLNYMPYLLLAFLHNFSLYSCASNHNLRTCLSDLNLLSHRFLLIPIFLISRIIIIIRSKSSLSY